MEVIWCIARRSEILLIPRSLLVSLMKQSPVGMFNYIKRTDIVGTEEPVDS